MDRIPALRPELVGKLNERQILRLLQARGPASRAAVARLSGLSPPTVSKAVASLIQAGLLEETATADNARGRPAVNLRLATARVQVVGLAVDADRCEVVTAGLDGVLHADPRSFPTPNSYAKLLDTAEKHCRAAMGRRGVATLGLGVSLPGLIDDRAGRGVLSPNLPCTNGRTPAKDLGDRLGVPGVLVQELHALCLAEQHYGQAVGRDDFAVLDIGVGVGLGVMAGGRLMTGHSGLAGEIGHVTVAIDGGWPCGCGNAGCLETVCNDAAFARRVSRKLGREVGFDEAVALARSGRGPLAAEVYETAEYLAVAVAAVVNLFNPSAVYIHARQFEADDGLFDRVVGLARKRALPPAFADAAVLRAKAHKRQGAVAAAVRHLTDAVAVGVE